MTSQDQAELEKIFTIGYSSFDILSFAHAIGQYNVTMVVDVRSSPYSKFKPEFNKENLSARLWPYGIAHIFLGDLLGAMPQDRSVYRDGVIDYDLVGKSSFFKQGVEHLRKESSAHRLVLMCAEKDPLHCHRTMLISRNITGLFDIFHICYDASLERQCELELRLKKKYGYDQPVLFGDSLQLAYEAHSRKMSPSPSIGGGEDENNDSSAAADYGTPGRDLK